MSMHDMYHYSITCHSDDRATIYCLRALAHFAERAAQKNIAWSGTDDESWERDDHCITLRFTNREYRQIFRDVGNDLLGGRWTEQGFSDHDRATPKQR